MLVAEYIPRISRKISRFSEQIPRFFAHFPRNIENLGGKTFFSFIRSEKHKFIRVYPRFSSFFSFFILFYSFSFLCLTKEVFFGHEPFLFAYLCTRHLITRWLPIRRVANHKMGNDGTRKDGGDTSSNVIVPERLI